MRTALATLERVVKAAWSLLSETSKNLLCEPIAVSCARSRLAYLLDRSRCSLLRLLAPSPLVTVLRDPFLYSWFYVKLRSCFMQLLSTWHR